MDNYTRKFSLSPTISPAKASVNDKTAPEPSKEMSEADQEQSNQTTHTLSPYLEARNLKVTEEDGVETLTGQVKEGALPSEETSKK